ncbi:hypothetical protein P7C73_g4580, partial [Tremellales sp. Uapishka_1]
MAYRDTRSSYPATGSIVDRSTRASSLFPYSIARPPTDFSARSLPAAVPPLPSHPQDPFHDRHQSDYQVVEDVEPSTAWSKSSFAGPSTAGGLMGIREEEEGDDIYGGILNSPPGTSETLPIHRKSSTSTPAGERTTLPSVLDFDALDPRKSVSKRPSSFPPRNLAPKSPVGLGLERRRSYVPEPSPDIMTVAAHQRLGRMSTAPPRYTLPAMRPPKAMAKENDGTSKRQASMTFVKTWRIFIDTAMVILASTMMTITIQNTTNALSGIVLIRSDTFTVSAGGGQAVVLGVNGWCQRNVTSPKCLPYTEGNFVNANGSFSLPGNSLLSTLYAILLTSLVMHWLLAIYSLVTAFLHFYLFFALSIPYDHLSTTASSDLVVAEVDLRVKAERPPYEGYAWVWWAWWAHRRSPVGGIYALLAGVGSLSSFFVGIGLEQQIVKATSSKGVSLGAGAFVPLLGFFLTLDPFISAIQYVLSFRTSFSIFLSPPSPSASALLLPPSLAPLEKTRTSTTSSFFAPRQATTTTFDPLPMPPVTATSPSAALDPETIRWLEAYPRDAELVPLISDLRRHIPNEDFLLSDVGLLYLRPETDENALLVPPRGVIRNEIVEDSHAGHVGVAGMVQALQETFWWNGIEADVARFVDSCAVCSQEKGGTKTAFFTEGAQSAVAKTAFTEGAQSAMAAEMAFAMRKAQEEGDELR